MKKILSYVIIFISTMMILFFLLVLSSTIPRSAIEDNIKESVEFYKKKAGIHRIKNKRIYTYIHYFADTRKLNILYNIDSNDPIKSTLWAKYYQDVKMDTNKDFISLVEESKEPTTEYLRYWNGCMLFLRPLLTIFNMEQIYNINKAILALLMCGLLVVLFKKSKRLAFLLLLALILTASWYVPMCIEYSVMFYVMIITTIITIKIDSNKKGETKEIVNARLYKLFLITGVVTTFFDFLTTEILTIFVPLAFLLMIRNKEHRLETLKDTFKFIAIAFNLWFVGYAGMWLAKWVLSSLVLHINAFDLVKENFFLRINGLQGLKSYKELYNNVIDRNIKGIPLMYYLGVKFYKWEVKLGIAVFVTLIVVFTNWKELKNKKILIIFLIIGLTPYIRYLMLANHSYRHAMFTFRDQIVTIIVFAYLIIENLNYKLMFKEIKIKK